MSMSGRSSATWYGFAAVLGGILALAGCGPKPQAPSTEVTTVTVSLPVVRDVTDFEDYTGQTDAVQSVEVKARVTGYLTKIYFQPGQRVKGGERPEVTATKILGMLTGPAAQAHSLIGATLMPEQGDVLFEIDPRPYQADYDRANGQVILAEAKLKLAVANNARAKELSKTPGAISQKELDTYQAAQEEAQAEVIAAKANLETYRLNLSFTKVYAPIDGKISRNFLSVGNLVTKDQNMLTTILSEDPILAYFAVDSPTLLRAVRALEAGKIKEAAPGKIPVRMGLTDEQGYPHEGVVDFINNTVDPTTGTITMRGVFENPKPAKGPRLLFPGLFVRIRLPLGESHKAILVPDKAIGTDQSNKFVYVVDAQDTVQYHKVELGPLQEDGLRVITSGLQSDERVIVSGLQLVQPKMKVKTKSPEKAPPTSAK
jgi:multidrug efflux system membrane fusion protein